MLKFLLTVCLLAACRSEQKSSVDSALSAEDPVATDSGTAEPSSHTRSGTKLDRLARLCAIFTRVCVVMRWIDMCCGR